MSDDEYEEKSEEEWVEEEDEEENARFDAEMAALHSKRAKEQAQFDVVEEATARWRLNTEEYDTQRGPNGLPVGMRETHRQFEGLLKHPFGVAEVKAEELLAELVQLGAQATILLPPRGKLSAAQMVCQEAKANFGALDRDNFIRALWVQVKWQENQDLRERELVLQAFDSDVRALQIYLAKVENKEIKMPYPPPMPAAGRRSWDSMLDEEMRAKQKAYRYSLNPAKRDNTGWEPPNGNTY